MEDLNEEIKQKMALKKQKAAEMQKKKQMPKKAQEKVAKEQKVHKPKAVKKNLEDNQVIVPAKNGKSVKITFLGGVGEIGKNMTAIEYDNEMIVIDCGLAFPTGDFPGVDLIVPDISYLIANKSKLKGILLTHGHEDHIGALPFVLNELKVPVYGSAMTLALVENKLKEYPKIDAKLVTVKPKNLLKIGSFQVEFIKVSHSIAGALALSINTPCGNIVHTGDFKIDFAPIDGVMTDLTRLGELGKKGVNLLLCESTNVCRKGYSMSERNVGKTLEDIFEKHKEDRLFVATFASNIHRMQQLLWLAEKFKRKVAFSGRSMINVSDAAMKIGELTFDKSNIIDIDKIDKYADNELLIITTGSQGEPMSALTRMAYGEFPKIKIGEGDTIIFSSSPIPGNEKSVYNVINTLFKSGANVIYDELAEVHASGHACQEELKTMHALTNPKFFIPVHGEYRHLKRHKELSIEMGMNARDIIIPDMGMQVEMTENYIRQSGFVTAGIRLVDGSGLGDLGSNVLKERKQLSEEGFCVAVLNMSELANEKYEPIIITRGVVYDKEAEAFNADAKATMVQVLREQDLQSFDPNEIRNIVKKALSNFIFKRSKRRPIIIVILNMN
ncbi:MAG: ribonuclease J [Firmicutes bacterium]|nr:ribonuclease J [Bacillota bacterium]